ncbi:META domain-containing protein [Marinilabilia sp.]|uniref:META domain-containing protein n=1 Tax=Marinilabilia sp. TaxID=2021252 RepID=UPI0025C2B5AC|nr:META domain-containing protein [Marinilabilia sp.]
MRIIKLLLFATIALTTTISCSKKTSGKVTSTNESEQIEEDMTGVYTGLLPCIDCPGIETTITVNPDNSYEISQVYTEKDSVPFISSGLIKKSEKENIWVFKSRYNETFYQFEDSVLRMLNNNQQEVDELLEQHYILKKKESEKNKLLLSQFVNKEWALKQLSGKTIDSKDGERKPHVIFDAEEDRVHGYAGCNSFFGDYQVEDDGTVRFENIASTKMYCSEKMEMETAFLQALQNCDKLSVDNNTMQLMDAENKVIAVFKED